MSSSGFVDEAPGPDPNRGTGREGRRRTFRLGGFFSVAVLALIVFGGWAWTSRAHADDVVAFEALRDEVTVMDRSLTPERHSEIPPCRDRLDGTITRTYSESDGPAPEEIVGYLQEKGWEEIASTPPAVVTMAKTAAGHELSVSVIATSSSTLALTATSTGSRIGCLLR
ncbi:MAG: hypothetical protein ABI112_16510 [Terracoccus sp.]